MFWVIWYKEKLAVAITVTSCAFLKTQENLFYAHNVHYQKFDFNIIVKDNSSNTLGMTCSGLASSSIVGRRGWKGDV